MSDPDTKDGSAPHSDVDSSSSTPESPVDNASIASPASATSTTSDSEPTTPASSSSSSSTASSLSSASDAPAPPTLEQARLFLRSEVVRNEPRPRKAAFLASKGLTPEQIDTLLGEEEDKAVNAMSATPSSAFAGTPASSEPSSVPPIVTYPEFLARPPAAPRPPPLVTPDVLLRTLYGSAAVSALLYGTAKFVLAPMVSSLTDARRELHGTASDNLDQLLRKLEGVVSVVPEAAKATTSTSSPSAAMATTTTTTTTTSSTTDDDDDDSYDDPTEVFHRDIGVQTELPPSPKLAAVSPSANAASSTQSATPPPPSAVQADRLNHLVDSLRGLGESYSDGAGVRALDDVRTLLGTFRADVDELARPPAYAFGSSYLNLSNTSSYGASSDSTSATNRYVSTTRNEPYDEIRKAKENIRRVKGALLTARTFPAAR